MLETKLMIRFDHARDVVIRAERKDNRWKLSASSFSLDLSPLTDESIEQTHRTSSAFVSHQVLITIAAGFRHSFHDDCLSERPLAI